MNGHDEEKGTGAMTRHYHTAETQASPRTAAACACAFAALIALCLLAWPSAALADEVDGEGSFDLNLSMSVEAANDPEAAIHPVSVHVANRAGEHVGGATVSYELRSAYAPAASTPATAGALSAESQAAFDMVRAGTATTAADGTADLAGIVAGCDYLLTVEADGHVRHESVRTCKGEDAERWEVVMEKADGSDGGVSGGTEPGGSPGASGGQGDSSPLARLFALLPTGDALAPFVLGAAGALLVAASLLALARRRRGARDGR